MLNAPLTIPKQLISVPPRRGSDIAPEQLPLLKKVDFAVTLPWDDVGKNLQLVDNDGKVITTKDLSNVTRLNNEPNYYSLAGDRRGKEQFSKNTGNEITNNSTTKKIDITFVGDDYTSNDLTVFHDDVNRFIDQIEAIEPFKSRASQIAFHYVDNTADLGCQYNGRAITCNDSKVTSVINDSGTPYDKIGVIVNNPTYGGITIGFNGTITTAYNGDSGPTVFTHEIGHAFGLLDEYTYGPPGYYSTSQSLNCAVSKPDSGWGTLIAPKNYVPGCNDPSHYGYRPSPKSMMRDLSPYFNSVSQRVLNASMNKFTDPYTDDTKPTSTLSAPAANTEVSEVVKVESSNADNAGVSRVELWQDGKLYDTAL